MTNFRLFQRQEFADDNFKFDENGRTFFKKGRKHCLESRNCLLRAVFPQCFQKTCTADM